MFASNVDGNEKVYNLFNKDKDESLNPYNYDQSETVPFI
jgi:hypothetical protein